MSNVWGSRIKVSIFGESHGKSIGIVIGGLPPGLQIDMNEVDFHMKRRAPGTSEFVTPRKEEDKAEILSGMFNGMTTGAPLCAVIANRDTRSVDYTPDLIRPGTSDLTAYIKYRGYNDYRGSGHFSGRITAPLTFAGSVARQLLEKQGIKIYAHILKIADIRDESFDPVQPLAPDYDEGFTLLNKGVKEAMEQAIKKARDDKDSVGGIIECAAIGVGAGLGSPFFYSIESSIASMMFSIPAIKGIEFGSGFRSASMKGSELNDEIYHDNGHFRTITNNCGGVNGGITNGMPLIFRVAVKPTASIGKPQTTIDLKSMERAELVIKGRHDPCIVPRAVVVVESALALCLLDALLEEGNMNG